jgi:hypothetical protein
VADLKVSAATAAAMTDAGLFPASIGGADKSVSGSALKAFVGVYNGAGSPEGSIVGSVGDIWLDRTNGQVYEKRSGAATNTGWQLISYPRVTNGSTGSQGPLTASATTLLTGSTLAVPLTGLKALTRAYWAITMSKTAAGTLTNNFDVRIGTAGSTADTSRLSFATGAGTGVIDQAIIEIWAHMRTVGAGTAAVIVGMMKLTHGLASTGWSTVPAVIVAANSSGFDSTVANLILSVSMTTAASTVPSVQAVEATLEGL